MNEHNPSKDYHMKIMNGTFDYTITTLIVRKIGYDALGA